MATPTTSPVPSPPPAGLQRRLGPLDAAAIVVSNVIGGGIFFLPPIIAALVGDPMGMLWVWLAGGLLAFAGAMAYAELAALRPRSGGEYVYLYEAYGPMAAFLTGWTSFVAGFSGAIAASAVALAEYLGRFIPAARDTTPIASLPLPFIEVVLSRRAIVALAAVAILTVIHVRGLGPGRLVQNTLAALKTGGLLVFIALALSIGAGTAANVTADGNFVAMGFLLALIPVMFGYSGWNAAAYVAEEVRNPGRNVPLALALGTGAVVVIYLLLNVVYLYALPFEELATLEGSLFDTVGERLFGGGAAFWLTIFTVVSIAASISAMVFAGPRVYFAMARDGLFLSAAARVHTRYRTPALAIVAQSIWSGVLIMSGSLSELVSYTGFAVVLFSGIAVAGLFVLRRRFPSDERPYKTFGYPWTPGVFVLAAAVMVVNEILRRPGPALFGTVIILAGIPVYYWFRRRRR
jgi:basic amino acid/polyamine antiporter, APA family